MKSSVNEIVTLFWFLFLLVVCVWRTMQSGDRAIKIRQLSTWLENSEAEVRRLRGLLDKPVVRMGEEEDTYCPADDESPTLDPNEQSQEDP